MVVVNVIVVNIVMYNVQSCIDLEPVVFVGTLLGNTTLLFMCDVDRVEGVDFRLEGKDQDPSFGGCWRA